MYLISAFPGHLTTFPLAAPQTDCDVFREEYLIPLRRDLMHCTCRRYVTFAVDWASTVKCLVSVAARRRKLTTESVAVVQQAACVQRSTCPSVGRTATLTPTSATSSAGLFETYSFERIAHIN